MMQSGSSIKKIYKSFEPYFPKPDLIVFLETSVTELVRRIGARGKDMSKKFPYKLS